MLLREYVSCRTTLHRLTDSRVIRGWVRDFDGVRVTVNLKTNLAFSVGEKFYFQIHGREEDAHFYAQMVRIEDPDLSRNAVLTGEGNGGALVLSVHTVDVTFKLITEIQTKKAIEASRRTMDWITGRANTPKGQHDVRILDASEGGVGLLIPVQLDRGDRIELTLDSPVGVLAIVGEVVYSRPDPMMPSVYRSGVKFQEFDRLGSVRWKKLMEM